jgi:hypothetical protein
MTFASHQSKKLMQFDPNNAIVKLCAEGMEMEGRGNPQEARKLFYQAWNEAATGFEKFTAAHYVARHQENVADKLRWDREALQHALSLDPETVKGALPSLYLNIAKCYEDLDDTGNAKLNYELGLSYTDALQDDGYGSMIRKGILAGIERITQNP